LFYYRDKDQKEIDLLIRHDGTLYPVEIKKSAAPGTGAARHFGLLEKLGLPVGHGAVVCLIPASLPLSRNTTAIPVSLL